LDDLTVTLAEGSVGEALRLAEGDGAALYRSILGALAQMPGAPREGLTALAERAAGRGAEETYDLLLTLTARAVGRIVRHGAGGRAPLLAEEAEAAARLCPHLGAAQAWAAELQEMEGRAAHARAVNLDPAQVVLDMWLAIDRQARLATA
ncbi:MAG: DNA polymerase III subunit delta', partial [Pseudomonadota bacterium]